ncbi:MAG: hypothetical protein A3J94_00425 [Syntrophus sp. RIFOXYC2_FULL_54_9]|nr:MAG: hypothetical protein A3J94_00425 [Syntrophus sp. RIFOXYC2_FULL_54_9]
MAAHFRTIRTFVTTLLFLVVFLIGASLSWAQVKITFPADNARVSGEVIELTGVAADPKGQLEVNVLTDKWYLQNGTAVINADGSWSYAPCYVSGQGRYNNHTIRVTIIKNGSRVASTSVRGIVRKE